MLLSIQHRTELKYDAKICESVHELRVAPPSGGHQTLRAFGLGVSPTAQVYEHVDWLGNRVHQFSVLDSHDRVEVVTHGAVETHPESPDLASAEDLLPLSSPDLALMDYLAFTGPVVRDPRLPAMAERIGLTRTQRAANAVLRVMLELHDVLNYEKGVTKASSTVADALDAGGGVCQDFAHVALALLRSVGIPSRYVSGYLFRADVPELETHAWCEAHVPSLGWVGFDPTHAQFVGERHVILATGRTFIDVPPNRGTFKGAAAESIAVSVAIAPIETSPRGRLAPRPTPSPTAASIRARLSAESASLALAQQTPLHHLLPRQQQSQQQQGQGQQQK